MSELYYESSISHHGVLGQKWGVRRYQSSNGRLTSLGKKHVKVKDVKRSERGKTDRTKAYLESQKKQLSYEKSLIPKDTKVKDSINKSVNKAKLQAKKAKYDYDMAIAESKRNKLSGEDAELAKFLNSMSDVVLANAASSKAPPIITKSNLKKAAKVKITDIKDDLVFRIDNFKFK